jgi:hypothetical protein
MAQREDRHLFSKPPEHVVNDCLLHADSPHVAQRLGQAAQSLRASSISFG